jgi:hypothetical protein
MSYLPLTREEELDTRRAPLSDRERRLLATLDSARRIGIKRRDEALVVVFAGGRVELYAHNRRVRLVVVPECYEENEEQMVDALVSWLPPGYEELFMPGLIKSQVAVGQSTVDSLTAAHQTSHLIKALNAV